MFPDRRFRKRAGFTLVDMATAVAVLATVSAFAVPRYLELGAQTRVSRLDALTQSIKAAAQLTRAAALTTTPTQTGAAGRVVVDGAAVSTRYGYPAATAEGIAAAIGLDPTATGPDGVSLIAQADSIRIEVKQGWSPERCSVVYTGASATSGPTIAAPTTSGC